MYGGINQAGEARYSDGIKLESLTPTGKLAARPDPSLKGAEGLEREH